MNIIKKKDEKKEKRKMRMKRILAVVSAIAITLSMGGCGKNTGEPAPNNAQGDVKKVAIIQLNDNGAFTDMREGFKQELIDQGVPVAFKEFNAQGDATTLQSYVQNAITEGVDLIATVATPATQAVVSAQTDIPNVFIAVSDPIKAEVLTSMDAPDKNATGTQNPIPVEKIFETADTLTPGINTYGMIYTEAQPNSVSTCNAAKEYLTSIGKAFKEKTVANSAEVQQAIEILLSECDAIFVPNDATIQDAMPIIVEAANRAKKPVYGSSAVMPISGALAAVAISDREIGKISAGMAIEILNGKSVAEVPAKVVEATVTTINKSTADVLGIRIPESLEAEIVGE